MLIIFRKQANNFGIKKQFFSAFPDFLTFKKLLKCVLKQKNRNDFCICTFLYPGHMHIIRAY